jgi:UDP-N-acetyl-2-amino-2-deoxyglucuronate dehydrogenase
VTILTPSGSHYEHSVEIISHYKKHLLIEKPFVMTTTQGIALKKLADEHKVEIFPLYQNRFNKAVQKVKLAMQPDGELGKLRVGTVRVRWCRPQRYYNLSPWRGTWAMDGGAMTNQGIHFIDLLRYLCGEVKRVHAKLGSLGADIEVEDTGVAILEFQNGGLGVIEIMTSARPDDFEASISCVCESGMAMIGGIATNVLQTFSPDPQQTEIYSETFPTVYGFGHNVVIQSVTDSLLLQKNPLIEFDDGLKTLQLLHALYKSDEQNGWVDVETAGDSARLGKPDEKLYDLYRTPQLETA